MQDCEILDLYFARNEQAIVETAKKHGAACMQVAMNILSSRPDAEECVNDTYLKAWNTIPPEHPHALRTFLCRITRNLSLDRFRYLHRSKRNRDLEVVFSELEACIPAPEDNSEKLIQEISTFLRTRDKLDRMLFIGRYFQAESLKKLSLKSGLSESHVAVRLFRTREALRAHLSGEGYHL